ncbi:MAG: SMC-Scp complex subunit ScpB [Chitinophagales bacterium]|nr:SMC-Scp complex subunit ScpB [Chitinophagales bacterium]
MENLAQHIEAIIFSSEQAVKVNEILAFVNKVDEDNPVVESVIIEILNSLSEKYTASEFAFELKKTGGGWQFLSKEQYHQSVSLFLNIKERKRLSTAALETLSIIAYKQPVTKAEIEVIRGVNCDYTVHKLLEKDLIEICGKKDAPGKPILYEVSQTFLDYFGINSTQDLPQLKEISSDEENSIGNPS